MRPRAFSMLVTQNEQDIPPILSCSFSTPSCRANASDACVRAARSPRRSGASTLIRTPPLTSYLIAEPLDRLPDLIRAQPRRVERHNDPLGLGVRPRVLDAGAAPIRCSHPAQWIFCSPVTANSTVRAISAPFIVSAPFITGRLLWATPGHTPPSHLPPTGKSMGRTAPPRLTSPPCRGIAGKDKHKPASEQRRQGHGRDQAHRGQQQHAAGCHQG